MIQRDFGNWEIKVIVKVTIIRKLSVLECKDSRDGTATVSF